MHSIMMQIKSFQGIFVYWSIG